MPVIRIARGYTGAPTRAEKKMGAKFTEESLSALPRQRVHPLRQSKSPIFEEIGGYFGSGRGYLGSFSVCFEGDDKNRSSTFSGKKSAPPRQNHGYTYDASKLVCKSNDFSCTHTRRQLLVTELFNCDCELSVRPNMCFSVLDCALFFSYFDCKDNLCCIVFMRQLSLQFCSCLCLLYFVLINNFIHQLEMRSVERGICPIATSTSIMNEQFQ